MPIEAELQVDPDECAALVANDPFTMEDLRLLVDFFYLPHQHGERALHILKEFCWLKENAPGQLLPGFHLVGGGGGGGG